MVDITHKDVMESNSIEIDGIEFVKVVRCKECKHMKPFCYDFYLCGKNHVIPKGCVNDWFCADGERKEQEDGNC